MSILVLLRLILFIYIENVFFFTDLFILQLRLYFLFLGNLYIHVKCNAPLALLLDIWRRQILYLLLLSLQP